MPEIPNFFRRRRDELGLTQRQIALELDMTDTAVGLWERGGQAPRITLADRLAEIYKVSPDQMLREIKKLAEDAAAAKVQTA